MFKLGYIRDLKDHRDINVSSLLKKKSAKTSSEDVVNWENDIFFVLDQQQASSCVGMSGAGAISTVHHILHKEVVLPSGSFLYSIARREQGWQYVDEGACIRDLMKGLTRYGFCSEKELPYSVEDINEVPPWHCYGSAFDQKILSGYYRIDSIGSQRVAEIKQAIKLGHLPVFGMDVSESYMDYSSGVIQELTGEILGGHAQFLYGYYKDDYVWGQGSWGLSWGEQGKFRISQKLLDLFDDIWVFETVPLYTGVS